MVEQDIAENNGHDESGYTAEFLQEMQEKHGINFDANKNDPVALITATSQRPAAVHYAASVPRASEAFKNNHDLSILLDLTARAIFKSEQQLNAFNEFVDWCLRYKQPLHRALFYAAGSPAIKGRSRDDLVAIATTINENRKVFNQQNANKRKGSDSGRID